MTGITDRIDTWFHNWFAGNPVVQRVEGAEEHIKTAVEALKARAELIVEEPAKIASSIEAWFVSNFHGTVVSRATEVYNHASAAKADLVKTLTPPADPAPPADAAKTS